MNTFLYLSIRDIKPLVPRFLLLMLFVFFANALYGQTNGRSPKWAQPVENIALENMYQIDTDIYRAEQPDAKGFAELEKFGIKEVLNLRSWHNDNDEAQGTNLILHRVKMSAHNINNDGVINALRIIKNRKGPIVLHCRHGSDRTGVITAMYRIVYQGWSREEAIEELKNGGYGFHRIYFNIPNYIKKVDIEMLKKKIEEQ